MPPSAGVRGPPPGQGGVDNPRSSPEALMAGARRPDPDQRARGGGRQDEQDTAPGDDKISRERADFAPTGADVKPTIGGTLKRLVKEVSQDNLTDWAAALT